jgi:hypothetical protein
MVKHSELLEQNIFLKAKLIAKGCNIEASVVFPADVQKKKIHLYAHSKFSTNVDIPDDIIIWDGHNACIARIRYNPDSELKIICQNKKYFLQDTQQNTCVSIRFVSHFLSGDLSLKDTPSGDVKSICSFLGMDLLGITPSNHCFYYKKEEECKFCEIWQTYKEKVEYAKAIKSPEIIAEAVNMVLEMENVIKHVALTSGNVKNYDFTSEFLCQIGEAIQKIPNFHQLQDILCTLMPPDNFELIRKMKKAGFNKIYFPLEVFNKSLFKVICPGKDSYGYEKIIDALEFAVDVFGVGNVYTNFVYGIQSLNESLDCESYHPIIENEKSLFAVDEILNRKIVPVFTIYHYGGFNKIGDIRLSSEHMFDFFKILGEKIFYSNVIQKNKETIIFDSLSLSNTLYNETYMLSVIRYKDMKL